MDITEFFAMTAVSATQTKAGSISRDLGALLETADGADINLVVGSSEIPAHSVILAARSPVFAAMVRNDMKEASSRCIEIKDVGEAVIRQMLSFIYTDTAPELGSMAAELLAVADKYDLPLLKRSCEKYLARDLTVENAAAAAALAVAHRCPGLRNATVEFVACHPEVMGSAGWAQLLRESTDAAVEVCERLAVVSKQLALAQPSPEGNRILSEEHKKELMERLFKAASKGSVDEMWALVDAGVPIDEKGDGGNTALHVAVENSHAAAVKFLLHAGADVNGRNSDQQTPLHRSVYISDIHIMWTLLATCADEDAQDKQGDTPLHLAGRHIDRKQHLKALLLAGADSTIKNNNGCIPNTNNVDSSIQSLFNNCSFSF